MTTFQPTRRSFLGAVLGGAVGVAILRRPSLVAASDVLGYRVLVTRWDDYQRQFGRGDTRCSILIRCYRTGDWGDWVSAVRLRPGESLAAVGARLDHEFASRLEAEFGVERVDFEAGPREFRLPADKRLAVVLPHFHAWAADARMADLGAAMEGRVAGLRTIPRQLGRGYRLPADLAGGWA